MDLHIKKCGALNQQKMGWSTKDGNFNLEQDSKHQRWEIQSKKYGATMILESTMGINQEWEHHYQSKTVWFQLIPVSWVYTYWETLVAWLGVAQPSPPSWSWWVIQDVVTSNWATSLRRLQSALKILYDMLLACINSIYRRKFRSQTSDNMDRDKSRGGKSQRGEEEKWEDQRRERERRKKMQVRGKVGKSRFSVFF